MPYTQHIQVRYETVNAGRIRGPRSVDISDRPGGRSSILLASSECRRRVADQLTGLSGHQIVHGSWRQRWTDDGRMRRPAQGLGLAVSRWERVPGRVLPSGHAVVGVEEDGMCVWLIDEDDCTQRIQNDMNDLLFRLAGDGLWIQCWLRNTRAHSPISAAPAAPLVLV
ncbi:hypothetical protein ACFWBR_42485 [Streptomyces sp. NPDC060006]|uniref:hypothetical protein n=1 Tax=unclassified Streptomyces TaxID=2593676 RepID=UPI0036C5A123